MVNGSVNISFAYFIDANTLTSICRITNNIHVLSKCIYYQAVFTFKDDAHYL